MYSTHNSHQILIELGFSPKSFEKSSNIRFHENLLSRSQTVPCGWMEGQTDMTELVISFCNFGERV
jgi:hypothetical protein